MVEKQKNERKLKEKEGKKTKGKKREWEGLNRDGRDRSVYRFTAEDPTPPYPICDLYVLFSMSDRLSWSQAAEDVRLAYLWE